MTIRMRVLIACEFSGITRTAFRLAGHEAWSCDLLEAEDSQEYHIRGDCLNHLDDEWDMMIAHPPCTYLAASGARWFSQRMKQQEEALEFVRRLMTAPVKKIAIENPISVISTKIRKPDQIIQPWQFGHGETKATCLWLKGLPKLTPTKVVAGRKTRVWYASPSPDRWRERSRSYPGIADAMVQQWTN